MSLWGSLCTVSCHPQIKTVLLLLFQFGIFIFRYISQGKGNKRKNKQMGLHQTKKFFAQQIINTIKKTIHQMGEHICPYI